MNKNSGINTALTIAEASNKDLQFIPNEEAGKFGGSLFFEKGKNERTLIFNFPPQYLSAKTAKKAVDDVIFGIKEIVAKLSK